MFLVCSVTVEGLGSFFSGFLYRDLRTQWYFRTMFAYSTPLKELYNQVLDE